LPTSQVGGIFIFWYDKVMETDAHRRRARIWLAVFTVMAIGVLGGAWYLFRSGSLVKIASWENVNSAAIAQKIANDVSYPAPLVATGTKNTQNSTKGSTYRLTLTGVISETNTQRKENGGLAALGENALLDKIALERLDDMATKQYFAHVSPSGSSAIVLADADGYAHIALGENLALGNFLGDFGVVDAWMHSPGHRANILNTHYTEIGVAVKEVIFNGNDTWLAVQVFGRPASDCPSPDATALSSLNATAAELLQMQNDLTAQKAKIDAMSPSDPAYVQTVDQYNAAATKYNTLAAQAKANIAAYNTKVEAYNACLAQ
jgi:uncharacterized protein YkwD